MRKLLLYFPLLVLMLFAGCDRNDKEPYVGHVEGVLLDGSNVVSDAEILIYNDNGIKSGESITNSEGKFVINNLPVGSYTIKGRLNGVYSNSTEFTLIKNATQTVEVNFRSHLAITGLIFKGNRPHSLQKVSVHDFEKMKTYINNIPLWWNWDLENNDTNPNPFTENQYDESLIAEGLTNEDGYVEIWDLSPKEKFVLIAWDYTNMVGHPSWDPTLDKVPTIALTLQYYNGEEALHLSFSF